MSIFKSSRGSVGFALLVLAATGCVSGVVATSDTPLTEPSPNATSFPVDCGNGRLDAGEFCDPTAASFAPVACTSLGSVYKGGTAGCRSDCRGYDTSSCVSNQVASGQSGQYVIPKLRDPSSFGESMCSSGEPFAFKLSLSPTKSKNWVIFLGGGGLCDGTVVPCTDRNTGAFKPMSSAENAFTTWGEDASGVTSRDPAENPTFWDANFVVASYCTNDLWSGTNTVPRNVMVGPSSNPSPRPLVFTGRRAVQSIFGSLNRYFGLDDRDPNTRVLFTGNSAGSDGMQNTADVAVDALPSAAASQRIWFVSSAGYMLANWNEPNYTLMGNGISDTLNAQTEAAIYKTEYSAGCLAVTKAAGQDPTACLSGLWNYRTMTQYYKQNRYLVFKNRQDQVYMSFQMIPFESSTISSADEAARQLWADKTTDELAEVRWAMAPSDPLVKTATVLQDNL
ncbi:MAG: hypothetical protein JST04_18415, partial [Bdellovibrionales bacterium]|nr:hypothetical protein [Bdellovibrionales bacterium]